MMRKRVLTFLLATAVAATSISIDYSMTAQASEESLETYCIPYEESDDANPGEVVTKKDVAANIKESRISYERDSETGYISVNEDIQTPETINNDRVSADKVLPAAYQGYKAVVEKYPATRSQNPYGTCWAFASVGTGEFDLVNQGAYTKNNIDLSELQLAYNMYHAGNDKMGNLDGDKNVLASDATDHYLDIGGNVYFAQHVLANWRGLVSESVLPYSKASSTLSTALGASYSYKNDAAKLVNTRAIDIHNDTASVKQAIYDHGAVYGSYYHDSGYYSENGGTALYYNSSNPGTTNHAITIVGWNDNFDRTNWASSNRPSKNGAWLIRNSWDTSSDASEYCYFWMSYEDTSLASAAYMLDYEPGSAYDNIYQHDGSATHVSLDSYQVANVFTAKNPDGFKSETLDAVMVSMTQDTNAKLKIEIYTDLTSSSNPQSGTLQSASTTTATTTHQGIYTFKLKKPVQLAPGQKYSIVITCTSGSKFIDWEGSHTYSGWVETTAAIDSGESFWKGSSSNGWYDLARMGSGYGNICVKGLTNNSNEEVHVHSWTEVIKKATASADGYIDQKCTGCGVRYRDKIILKPTVKLSYSKVTYSGGKKQPEVTVTNENGILSGSYYSVKYSNNVSVGRAKVIVQLPTQWFEPVVKYFTIVPKAPASSNARLNGSYNKVKFSWKASTGASGYTVYYKKSTASSYTKLGRTTGTSYTKSGLSSGSKYYFKVVPYYKSSGGTRYASLQSAKDSVYTLKKIGKPTVSKYSSSKVRVKWSNISGETGYQISRSTSSTGKNVVSTYATTSGKTKVVSAKRGVTYYYRVRAYVKVDGKTIYGPWSNAYKYKLR